MTTTNTQTPQEVPDGSDVCNNCGDLFAVLIPDPELKSDRIPEYDPQDPRCGVCRYPVRCAGACGASVIVQREVVTPSGTVKRWEHETAGVEVGTAHICSTPSGEAWDFVKPESKAQRIRRERAERAAVPA